MDKCEFCDKLELLDFIDDIIKTERKTNKAPKLYSERTVAIVIRKWTKEKGKRHAGRTTDYRHLGLGYKLNFCPECGRKLKEKNNVRS